MIAKETKEAIEVLKKADYEYILKILINNQGVLRYDTDSYCWFILDTNIMDYLYEEHNTYLNPKELEGFIEDIIDNEIFPIEEVAEDFISYYKVKYDLKDATRDKIRSAIARDCDFYIFEDRGLSDEVIKQLNL